MISEVDESTVEEVSFACEVQYYLVVHRDFPSFLYIILAEPRRVRRKMSLESRSQAVDHSNMKQRSIQAAEKKLEERTTEGECLGSLFAASNA